MLPRFIWTWLVTSLLENLRQGLEEIRVGWSIEQLLIDTHVDHIVRKLLQVSCPCYEFGNEHEGKTPVLLDLLACFKKGCRRAIVCWWGVRFLLTCELLDLSNHRVLLGLWWLGRRLIDRSLSFGNTLILGHELGGFTWWLEACRERVESRRLSVSARGRGLLLGKWCALEVEIDSLPDLAVLGLELLVIWPGNSCWPV